MTVPSLTPRGIPQVWPHMDWPGLFPLRFQYGSCSGLSSSQPLTQQESTCCGLDSWSMLLTKLHGLIRALHAEISIRVLLRSAQFSATHATGIHLPRFMRGNPRYSAKLMDDAKSTNWPGIPAGLDPSRRGSACVSFLHLTFLKTQYQCLLVSHYFPPSDLAYQSKYFAWCKYLRSQLLQSRLPLQYLSRVIVLVTISWPTSNHSG